MAGPIKIAILANASQARRELDTTASRAERLGTTFSKFRLPAALALGGIALGARSAIDSASDLNETVAKTGVIFGKQAGQIEAFADRAASSLGQSKTQALDAAAGFGQIGQKAGLSGAETAKFAEQFTGLASDLASFNNTKPEEAVVAISAAMRGESEPIRKYGVLLDDATLRARALKLGLISNVKQALTPQQKALAASKEILAQTSKAQGDFARTADGAANKTRIQAAKAEDLRAKLGAGLLPAYGKVLTAGNKILDFMSKNETLTKVAIGVIGGLALTVFAASKAIAIYTTVQKIQAINTRRVAAGQRALNLTMLANPIFLAVAAVAALVVGFVILYKRSERVREITNKVFGVLKDVGGFIKDVLIDVVRILGVGLLNMGIFGVRAFRTLLSAAFSAFGGILTAADKGLGWIPGLGGKISNARRSFEEFGDKTIGVLNKVETGLITARNKVDNLGRANAKPKIDTSSIDNANTRLDRLKQRLDEISQGVIPLNFGGGGTNGRTGAERLVGSGTTAAPVININVTVGPTSNPVEVGRQIVAALSSFYAAGGARP